MVDVGAKPASARAAVAEAWVRMRADTLRLIVEGGHHKGDVFAVARIAGIQAAKRCAVYDMCKAVDKGMVVDGVRLLEKRGGRSGSWQAEA